MIIVKDISPEYSPHPVRVSASRGRGGYKMTRQIIELGHWQFTNTITSVAKDNIIWIERKDV